MRPQKSVMILGGDSRLGRCFRQILKTTEFEVISTSRIKTNPDSSYIHMDLESIDDVEFATPFDFAIICAGMTSVVACQSDYTKAHAINVVATSKLIRKLIDSNCFIIYLSSNLVFSGERDFYSINDETNPRTNYGKFKVLIEQLLVNEALNKYAVLRMTKVVSEESNQPFPWQIAIKEGRVAEMYTNVMLAPVAMNEVADAVLAILRGAQSGIFQISSDEEISYYQYATNWALENDFNSNLIIPTTCIDPIVSKHNSLLSFLPH